MIRYASFRAEPMAAKLTKTGANQISVGGVLGQGRQQGHHERPDRHARPDRDADRGRRPVEAARRGDQAHLQRLHPLGMFHLLAAMGPLHRGDDPDHDQGQDAQGQE